MKLVDVLTEDKCVHINSGTECEIISDDTYGAGYGTITIRDLDTDEEHTMGGHEFEMEYKRT